MLRCNFMIVASLHFVLLYTCAHIDWTSRLMKLQRAGIIIQDCTCELPSIHVHAFVVMEAMRHRLLQLFMPSFS